MGEKTLRIGTGVDDLVVSRAGHLAPRLNPPDWHREANLIEDIPVRLRARRKRQDLRTEKGGEEKGGEFEREFGQELEDLGCEPMPTAAITPQQYAVCERHGGIWKTHA